MYPNNAAQQDFPAIGEQIILDEGKLHLFVRYCDPPHDTDYFRIKSVAEWRQFQEVLKNGDSLRIRLPGGSFLHGTVRKHSIRISQIHD